MTDEKELTISYTKEAMNGDYEECSSHDANFVTIEIRDMYGKIVMADFVFGFEKEAEAFARMYASLCGLQIVDRRR